MSVQDTSFIAVPLRTVGAHHRMPFDCTVVLQHISWKSNCVFSEAPSCVQIIFSTCSFLIVLLLLFLIIVSFSSSKTATLPHAHRRTEIVRSHARKSYRTSHIRLSQKVENYMKLIDTHSTSFPVYLLCHLCSHRISFNLSVKSPELKSSTFASLLTKKCC